MAPTCPSCSEAHDDDTGIPDRHTHRSPADREELQKRLRRIEGQVRGLERMIEEDAYCDHIIHQISAVQAALGSVKRQLFDTHVRSCVVTRVQEGDPTILDELLKTLRTMGT